MTTKYARCRVFLLLLLGPLACLGCSDASGSAPSSGGPSLAGDQASGGQSGTEGCPAVVCEQRAQATGPDGETYRGRIYADVTIATDETAAAEANPPVATLTYTGGEVDESDGGCLEVGRQPLGIQIFMGLDDSWVDASGTLHVQGAPRDGYFASGPNPYSNVSSTLGWAVDLSITKRGEVTAKLHAASALAAEAGSAVEADAGIQQIEFHGTLMPTWASSTPGCARMRVRGGATFEFPCKPLSGCQEP